MASSVAEEFQCAICVEPLKRPIRVLTCGHSFCHNCLARLCQSNQDKRCPTCRSPIAFPGNGVDGVSRNIVLENVIERLGNMKVISHTVKKEVFTPATAKQLQGSAATCQQQNNFKKAVETVQMIIDYVEGWDKLQPSIDQAKCLLSSENIPEVEFVCVSIASIVDANQSSRLTDQSRDVYDENIRKLVLKFMNVKKCDCAISLVRCRFQFIKNHYDGESRSDKLENIGRLMMEISSELSKQQQIKQQCSFMEEILDFMENMSNVHLKLKCKQTSCFLFRFSFCCLKAADWYKTIARNESAITLMKTAFNVEANQYCIFRSCHNNIGVGLQKTNQLFKAKAAFTKAIEMYNTTSDWASEEDKLASISLSKNNLDIIERKISQI